MCHIYSGRWSVCLLNFQRPNSQTFWNAHWAESLSARSPNKSADIFNIKYKCRSFYLILMLTVKKNCLHKIVFRSSTKSCKPCCTLWPLKRQLSSESWLFGLHWTFNRALDAYTVLWSVLYTRHTTTTTTTFIVSPTIRKTAAGQVDPKTCIPKADPLSFSQITKNFLPIFFSYHPTIQVTGCRKVIGELFALLLFLLPSSAFTFYPRDTNRDTG